MKTIILVGLLSLNGFAQSLGYGTQVPNGQPGSTIPRTPDTTVPLGAGTTLNPATGQPALPGQTAPIGGSDLGTFNTAPSAVPDGQSFDNSLIDGVILGPQVAQEVDPPYDPFNLNTLPDQDANRGFQ